jgi:plasmid stability protein
MATATVRNVNDDDYAILSEAAARHGRSISDELRLLIAEYAGKLRTERRIVELREIRARTRGLLGAHPDSVSLIHAIRDET